MNYLLFLLLSFLSLASNASTLDRWDRDWVSGLDSYATYQLACQASPLIANSSLSYTQISSNKWRCTRTDNFGQGVVWTGTTSLNVVTCPYGDNGTTCNLTCDAPNTLTDGQCVAPPPDVCIGKAGQSSGFKQEGNSSDPNAFYQPVGGGSTWVHPNYITGNDGCSMTVAPGTRCKVSGNGDYSCTGNATYSGETASAVNENEGPAADECTGESCPDTEPTPSSSGESDCTQWVYDAEGRRTRMCSTTAEAQKPGQAKCLTDGSLVCVKASPTPESDVKTRTDDVKETPTADGGKSTETTSTTNKTYCAAGACTTTTTTNKTTVVTNGSGEVTSETGTCEGDDCGDPESQEEENDEAPQQAELPQVGEDDDPGYGESLSNFTGRIQNSPLISAVSSIAFPSGGGSCSMGSVSLWGGSISFDHFCSMAAPVLGGLRYLFLSIWAIAAVRLFMTA